MKKNPGGGRTRRKASPGKSMNPQADMPIVTESKMQSVEKAEWRPLSHRKPPPIPRHLELSLVFIAIGTFRNI